MTQLGIRHPGRFQSSQATVLELWASPDFLDPPRTQLDTSSSVGKLEITQKSTQIFPNHAATCNSDKNLASLLGLEISKPFYLTEGREYLETRSDFSDKARRELPNGGYSRPIL